MAYDENDFLLGANELVELDGNDLEDWLGVDDDSPFTEDWAGAPSQLDFSFNYAQNDTSNNYGLHDYPPDMNHDSAVYILPEPEENVLLITIPDHLQQNPAFNSLPSFALDQQTLSSISSTSAGHHGAYMQANRSNIVRRPPLQVIQHITGNQMEPKVSVQTLKTDPAVGKRKQKFHLTREDGIEFSDIEDDIIVKEEDTPPNPDPSAKRRRVPPKKYMFDDMFVWPAGEEERKIVRVDKPIDESQRCQLCKKVFKKLAQHKCKWLMGAPPPKKFKCMRCFLLLDTPSLLAAHAKVHELACDGCLKTYKSKVTNPIEILVDMIDSLNFVEGIARPFPEVLPKPLHSQATDLDNVSDSEGNVQTANREESRR